MPDPSDINSAALPTKNRGRVDIIRQTAGRGGKTATVVKNFVGIGLPEKEQLAGEMQKACGTGSTVNRDKSKFKATNVRRLREFY